MCWHLAERKKIVSVTQRRGKRALLSLHPGATFECLHGSPKEITGHYHDLFFLELGKGSLKTEYSAGYQWLMCVILTTQEAEVWRMAKSSQDPIPKITKAKWIGSVDQAVECLLCKQSSNPSPNKKKNVSLLKSSCDSVSEGSCTRITDIIL
jgi:hypothetical protein